MAAPPSAGVGSTPWRRGDREPRFPATTVPLPAGRPDWDRKGVGEACDELRVRRTEPAAGLPPAALPAPRRCTVPAGSLSVEEPDRALRPPATLAACAHVRVR